MLNWLNRRTLDARLSETKQVKIFGVRFKIRKLNALDYMDGSRAIVQKYDEYALNKNKTQKPINQKELKKHLVDVICAGVVEPEITRKKEDKGLYVENLFTDIELANQLYSEIMIFTYGKKKL